MPLATLGNLRKILAVLFLNKALFRTISKYWAKSLLKFKTKLTFLSITLAKKFGVAIVGGLGLNIYNKNYASIVGLNHFINSAELTYEESVGGMTFAFGQISVKI